ncbi:protein DEFECTIVE IN MERISTEM SILENCING 3-like isoform X1 [Actinidia eriantha]|uniref:protein DEFECTIVE IN MERISTEM SILENCING 3-like isoform X1 n=1 Tax=Actinidia eriantha TaxID=165200 RepID=UPI0025895E4B|nr:protein DEFECTIVE IN MERISTEM SILENCING 3-like isoform X1 [Actinidia eriantha]
MLPSNHQLSVHTALPIQDPSALNHVSQSDSPITRRDDVKNGALCQAETAIYDSKKFEDDLHIIGLKIKKHEENIKFLKSKKNSLDDSILDLQVCLGKYHSSSVPMIEDEDHSHVESEEETVQHIISHEKSAAGILCLLRTRHGSQASHLLLTKDVLGIVATLGKVDDDNLSRLLSEYLGIETMLAVVCKTYDGVKVLETYEKDGSVSKSSGLHGLGTSIGRHLDERFLVICLENLRPYVGELVADDPQRKLDILKPRLPGGESPPGFLGFAVNMIIIDSANLFCLTANGHGLRETLFYNLFSRLQVYKTRADMLQALPCITDGALSLDGGMVKTTGMFSLGNREQLDVKFPKSQGTSNLPVNYVDTEKQIKELKWEKERMMEDMQREQALLNNAKQHFEIKKQEVLKFMALSASYATQQHIQASRMTPR